MRNSVMTRCCVERRRENDSVEHAEGYSAKSQQASGRRCCRYTQAADRASRRSFCRTSARHFIPCRRYSCFVIRPRCYCGREARCRCEERQR